MKFITVFMCLSFVSQAVAATQVIKEKGKPIQIIWEDGRKAQISIDQEPNLTIEFPFGLDENTCNEVKKVDCAFKGSIRIDRYRAEWTAHPDATKVGKLILHKGNNGGIRPFLDFQFRSSAERLLGLPSALTMPADEMSCKSYAWLPGVAENTVPQTIDIPRWDCEAMSVNPETGLTENRVIGGAIDLHMSQNANGVMIIEKVRTLIGPQPTIFQGDIVAMVHRTSDGYCQQSLKPNFGKLIDAINAYFGNIKDSFVAYPYGMDEFGDSKNSAVSALLNNPDMGDLQ